MLYPDKVVPSKVVIWTNVVSATVFTVSGMLIIRICDSLFANCQLKLVIKVCPLPNAVANSAHI